ncbi:unnamed protein product, partial [Mesorhabditis belari]|uniref:NR LBD domain-containing protein n=1 Tax=Mesorhabditis belari TaxID=2138241 RepID=A0AAF3EIQ1_9BILA
MDNESEPGPSGLGTTEALLKRIEKAKKEEYRMREKMMPKKRGRPTMNREEKKKDGERHGQQNRQQVHRPEPLLPNPAFEKVIEQLMRLTLHVDSMIDDPNSPPGLPVGPMNKATRTPIRPTAERSATQDDVVQDLERHYLLMIDYLRGIPEFTEMTPKDQEQLAQRRFFPFYWFKLTHYSWMTKCQGIAYANGSFYPGSLEHQPCPDVTRMVSRLAALLPLYNWLKLDNTEMTLLVFVLLFHDGVPELTAEGRTKIRAVGQLFLKVLHYYMRRKSPPLEYDKLAIRMGRIMLFVGDLTCMTHLTFSNMQVHEIMHVINWKKAVDGRLAWIHT